MAHHPDMARACQALHAARDQYRLRALELSLVPVDSPHWFPMFDALQALSAEVLARESEVDTIACDQLFQASGLQLPPSLRSRA